MIRYEDTDGKDRVFVKLCLMLDDYLNQAAGGEEERSEYVQYNQLDDIYDVIVAYEGEKAIGAVSFKKYDETTAELKRFFVREEYRGQGIAKELLRLIEKKARQVGYTDMLLETGKILVSATELYRKTGYEVIANYGQYENMENSVCMKKCLRNAIQYRFVSPSELDLAMQIRVEMLREVNGLPKDYTFSETLLENSREYFEHGNQVTVVAENEEKVIGCASLSYIKMMPTFSHPSGNRAHLMNVYTNASSRGRGIAKTMVKMLIQEARKHGATEISLDATEAGRYVYRALGFHDSNECMVLEL